MDKNYSTEKKEIFDNKYLKVFTADQEDIMPLKALLGQLTTVRKCNVTSSQSQYHPSLTLTVYCKPMFGIDEVEAEVKSALDAYYGPKETILDKIVTEATFSGIEARVIEEISKAQTSIKVCMAWFTNERIKSALEDRKQNGVEVKVIVYDDGINARHGVNLDEFEHLRIKAERGGIMHRKYCVLDNHIVITGSYNWSNNSEFKNDENVIIIQDWDTANKCTKEFNKVWNNAKDESV